MRPGLAGRVLARIGQEHARVATISLGGLDDSEIDQIVTCHGFTSDAFRVHVADIAVGNPLLAHTACFVAAGRGTYSWSDSAGLLSDLADDRLRHIGTEPDEHRAAAVALALLTTVRDGEELATLAGAVTALPPEPHRLDVLLEDLADAGLAAGPPYTMSPDAIAPVLAASALDPHARVKIKLFRALKILGRAASWTPPDDSGPDDGGLLGIAPLLPDSRARALGVHTAVLAAQLSVLAQAAYQRGDSLSLATLGKAVRELLPYQADLGNWLDVITLAGEVAPMAPRLLGELRDELVRQWPPAATTDLWDDDPVQRYSFDTERLLAQAVSLPFNLCVRAVP